MILMSLLRNTLKMKSLMIGVSTYQVLKIKSKLTMGYPHYNKMRKKIIAGIPLHLVIAMNMMKYLKKTNEPLKRYLWMSLRNYLIFLANIP